MKKATVINLMLCMLAFQLKAQTDTTVYQLTLKNDLVMYCQINSKEEGNYILVKKDGGGIQFFQWSEIKELKPTSYAINGAELKVIRKKNEIKRKYLTWNRCLIIKNNNDTIERWVQHKKDYSTMGEGQSRAILTANNDGVETNIQAEEFTELIVLGKEPVRYVSFSPKNRDHNNIYTVIVDGPCRLLHDVYVKRDKGAMMLTPGPMGSIASTAFPDGDVIYADRYYLSYKNHWMDVTIKDGLKTTLNFRNECSEILNDCPALASQLESKTFRSDDVREVLKEFNQCVANK